MYITYRRENDLFTYIPKDDNAIEYGEASVLYSISNEDDLILAYEPIVFHKPENVKVFAYPSRDRWIYIKDDKIFKIVYTDTCYPDDYTEYYFDDDDFLYKVNEYAYSHQRNCITLFTDRICSSVHFHRGKLFATEFAIESQASPIQDFIDLPADHFPCF